MNGRVRDPREVIREELLMHDRILQVLRDGPKTVPEIAADLACPAHEAMLWVMGMRKYGRVAETEEVTDDGYYRYRSL